MDIPKAWVPRPIISRNGLTVFPCSFPGCHRTFFEENEVYRHIEKDHTNARDNYIAARRENDWYVQNVKSKGPAGGKLIPRKVA